MKKGPKYLTNKYGESQPRASSIPEDKRYREDGTDEWYTTEDGFEFSEGDRLFDYYDCRWVIVGELINGYDGWFQVYNDAAMKERGGMLNSVRMSKNPPDWWTGDRE